MANKKISQLTSMGTVGIGSEDYFVTSEFIAGGTMLLSRQHLIKYLNTSLTLSLLLKFPVTTKMFILTIMIIG